MANLNNAILYGANLEEAWLEDADLRGADLEGAILINAEGLTINQLSEVETLNDAVLDSELSNKVKEK